MTTSTAQPGQPWARACGLLGACAATIAGVMHSVDPDVILFRATVAAIGVAVFVRMFCMVFENVHSVPEDDDE
jgi:hypothetical protein